MCFVDGVEGNLVWWGLIFVFGGEKNEGEGEILLVVGVCEKKSVVLIFVVLEDFFFFGGVWWGYELGFCDWSVEKGDFVERIDCSGGKFF